VDYWAAARRRAVRFRWRRAWAARDSSSRCSSRCAGWAATRNEVGKLNIAVILVSMKP